TQRLGVKSLHLLNPKRRWVKTRGANGGRSLSKGWMRLLLFTHAIGLFAATATYGQTFSYVSAYTDDVGKPTGLTLDAIDGVTYLHVSDHDGGRVFRYNVADGSRVQIAHRGTAPGEFLWPDAIAVEPATHDLYIADRQLHRVTRLTRDGAFVMKWGDTGT